MSCQVLPRQLHLTQRHVLVRALRNSGEHCIVCLFVLLCKSDDRSGTSERGGVGGVHRLCCVSLIPSLTGPPPSTAAAVPLLPSSPPRHCPRCTPSSPPLPTHQQRPALCLKVQAGGHGCLQLHLQPAGERVASLCVLTCVDVCLCVLAKAHVCVHVPLPQVSYGGWATQPVGCWLGWWIESALVAANLPVSPGLQPLHQLPQRGWEAGRLRV